MIKVVRGEEPATLRRVRRWRLARATLDRRAGLPMVLDGYAEKPVHDVLCEHMHSKCAYCEKDIYSEGSPIDHFRPRACAQDETRRPSGNTPRPGTARGGARPGNRQDENNGYWWLTWTWENLLFACGRCNSPTFKGNRFPLDPGTSPLAEGTFDLSQERPLLLDPTTDSPRDFIRFKWIENSERCIAYPSRLPEVPPERHRGLKTIEILGLDQNDHLSDHIRVRVVPRIRALLDATGSNNARPPQRDSSAPTNPQKMWRQMLNQFFSLKQPFHAATWDVLDQLVPVPLREKWKLEPLPALGDFRQFPPSFDLPDPVEFNHLPTYELKLRIRVLGERPDFDQWVLPVLSDVLAGREWTDKELASLFERDVATIRAWLARLAQFEDQARTKRRSQ